MNVDSVMTRKVWSLPAGGTLNEALELMWQHDLGVVPVVDAEGKVVGMITDRDVAVASFLRCRLPSEILVSDTISGLVYSCREQDSVASAEEVMRDHQVRRLPVIDDTGRLIGIISVADLVRVVSSGLWSVGASALVRTLDAIAQPRATASV